MFVSGIIFFGGWGKSHSSTGLFLINSCEIIFKCTVLKDLFFHPGDAISSKLQPKIDHTLKKTHYTHTPVFNFKS